MSETVENQPMEIAADAIQELTECQVQEKIQEPAQIHESSSQVDKMSEDDQFYDAVQKSGEEQVQDKEHGSQSEDLDGNGVVQAESEHVLDEKQENQLGDSNEELIKDKTDQVLDKEPENQAEELTNNEIQEPIEESPKLQVEKIEASLSGQNSQRTLLMSIWKSIFDQSEYFFRKPVDVKKVPTYLDVITEPMDLGTIKKLIKSDEITSVEALREKCMLVVNNATTFNDENTAAHIGALKLKSICENAIQSMSADRLSSIHSRQSTTRQSTTRLAVTPAKTQTPKSSKKSKKAETTPKSSKKKTAKKSSTRKTDTTPSTTQNEEYGPAPKRKRHSTNEEENDE